MRFEWDSDKARSNIAKHGVSFNAAMAVWNDPLHVIVLDRIEAGERRWHALGMVGAVTILVVVHTYPDPNDDDINRIIGAPRATAHERRRYEQNGA